MLSSMNAPGYPVWNASLSTMWARKNFPTLNEFIGAARQLGFASIELNHQIDSTMLAGIDRNQALISSIHEPCPADIPTETLKERDWLISALDEEKRRQGVGAIRKSIELADELGVGVIVVHAGNVFTDLTLEKKMRRQYDAKHRDSKEYHTLRNEQQQTRAALARPRLEAVMKSLIELLAYAQRFSIRIGLENRYHYADIPIPDEMETLLTLADPDDLGFIYDVGHAQALDGLGFFPHQEWLERFSTRIIGVHLHDVIGVEDHYAPGLGEIDFRKLAAFLPKEAFRTLEIQPKTTPEQVKAGLQHLFQQDCIGYL